MPILDGKPVDASVIDPAKHKYIGMWRPPEPPQERCDFSLPRLDAMVAWNNNLRSQDAWRKGELDVAQYVTISVLNDRLRFRKPSDIVSHANEPASCVHCSECDNVLWHVGTNKHGDQTVDVYRCQTRHCDAHDRPISIQRKQVLAADGSEC